MGLTPLGMETRSGFVAWHPGAGQFLVVGECPERGRMLSGIPDLYPLGASSIPSCNNQNCL